MCDAGCQGREVATLPVPVPAEPGMAGQITLDATFAGVRCAVARSLALLRPHVGPATLDGLEIVLSEVLNNVVEHAYGGSGGPIELWLGHRDASATVSVKDRGRPMPGGGLPCPAPGPARAAGAPPAEGGFGWGLIVALATDLRYVRSGETNWFSFRVGPL